MILSKAWNELKQVVSVAIAKDFRFIGRLCLDFAQTGDMGWGTRYERLTSPSAARWCHLARYSSQR